MTIDESVMKMSDRAEKARQLFLEGYNCSQSVVCAFEDEPQLAAIGHETLMRMSSSFGGGLGRLREVCGTVLGASIVLGIMFGYDKPKDFASKKEHYRHIQEFAARFKAENGSYVCRELLGLSADDKGGYVPEKRTAEYYKKRPCPNLCACAAGILDEYIAEIRQELSVSDGGGQNEDN